MEESIVLGGGCFWCVEAAYQLIEGVTKVESGYSGGSEKDADYYKIASGRTGHAEVVQVTFDTDIISLDDILDIFWAIHDPTTLNRQAYDIGVEYRSVIFYANETQKQVAEASRDKVAALWPDPIVTEISPLKGYYRAEEEQQNFFLKHPEVGYCQVIVNPKLDKLRQKFAARIKT